MKLEIWPDWLKGYNREKIQKDTTAAVTIAFVALPQSMAYALIAGVEPQYGLYAFVAGSILGALFGSSRHLQTGPTNASSVVVASTLGAFAGHQNFMGLVFLLGFLSGVFQLAAGLFKLGKLTQFISRSVLVGFVAGAGLLIAINQMANFLGLPIQSSSSVFAGIESIYNSLHLVRPAAVALGIGTIVLVLYLNRVSPKSELGMPILPSYLIAILIAAGFVWAFGLDERGVSVIGDISSSLLPVSLPVLNMKLMESLAPGALALGLIGLTEATSAARAVASESGDRLDVDREFVGQGLTKMVASFFSAIPVSGSLTRTQICYLSGAQTKMANIFAGIFLAGIVFFFRPFVRYIPLASLAGVVMIIAASMVNWRHVVFAIRATRSDAAAMFATFVAALIFKLDTAIFIGVGISLILFLRKVQMPRLTELSYEEETGFQELAGANHGSIPEITIIHVEGDIFFGAADFLEEEIANIVRSAKIQVLILRMKRACCLDATSLLSLCNMHESMQRQGKLLIISGVTGEVERAFRRTGVDQIVGEENIFFSDAKILSSTREALGRALEHVNKTGEKDYRVRLFYDRPELARANPADKSS